MTTQSEGPSVSDAGDLLHTGLRMLRLYTEHPDEYARASTEEAARLAASSTSAMTLADAVTAAADYLVMRIQHMTAEAGASVPTKGQVLDLIAADIDEAIEMQRLDALFITELGDTT